MIRVSITNNFDRKTVIVDEQSTIRDALNETGTEIGNSVLHLDGAPIQPGDLNKTFASIGYDGTEGHDSVFVTCVANLKNA